MPATEATFMWINPLGDVAREVTVPVLSPVSDTFSPNMAGVWTLMVNFHNREVLTEALTETFNVGFFVAPESPAGVAALVGSSLAALGGFPVFRRRHSNNQPSSLGDVGI
jgi:hypothetical protein